MDLKAKRETKPLIKGLSFLVFYRAGRGGRRFESSRPDHFFAIISRHQDSKAVERRAGEEETCREAGRKRGGPARVSGREPGNEAESSRPDQKIQRATGLPVALFFIPCTWFSCPSRAFLRHKEKNFEKPARFVREFNGFTGFSISFFSMLAPQRTVAVNRAGGRQA